MRLVRCGGEKEDGAENKVGVGGDARNGEEGGLYDTGYLLGACAAQTKENEQQQDTSFPPSRLPTSALLGLEPLASGNFAHRL